MRKYCCTLVFPKSSLNQQHLPSYVHCSLAAQLSCEPIYIVNRDREEVESMKSDMPALASKMMHVVTPEEAKSLEAPVYM